MFCKHQVGGSIPSASSTIKNKMHTKTKGKIAEMMISAKLMELGWKVLLPFGENNRYDLVAEKEGKFIRIQVKYVTPTKGILDINCKSSNNWSILRYTPNEIDFIAVFDSVNHNIYFISVSKLNLSSIKLRLDPPKNNQRRKIKYAKDFENLLV